MPSLAISCIAAVIAAWSFPQDPAQPREPAVCAQAQSFLQQGRHETAIEILRAALTADPTLSEERVLLSHVQAWLGNSEEALSLLTEGLGIHDGADDPQLQWEIGKLWRQLGDDGPFFERRGAQVAYLPTDRSVDERAWRNERYRRALDAFLRVLAAREDLELAYEQVGELQAELEDHPAALATWNAAAERFPASRVVRFGRARALGALNQLDEAITACEKVLELAPRYAAVHAMLAEYYERAGQQEAGAQAGDKARFYEWAPEFLDLDFADAGALLPVLAPRLSKDVPRDTRKLAHAARDAAIERLLETRDACSSKVLAALCFHHEDHGEVEQRCFAELEARGADAIPVLFALLENAQTTCTQGGAAHALASLRAPGLLTILIELLPGDVRPLFNADIAGALAKLGDSAAVPELLALADLPGADGDRNEDDLFSGEGRLDARHRAVWALGRLGGEEARAGLQAGFESADLGAACRVAHYRITRDVAMIAPLRTAVLADDGFYQDRTLDYLREFAPELANEIAKTLNSDTPEHKK